MGTSINTEQVIKSWAIVTQQPDKFDHTFYKLLFEIDPSTKPLFMRNMNHQSRKMMNMLSEGLEMLENTNELKYPFSKLGQRHIEYRVQNSQYASAGKALMQTLQEILGDQFNDELKKEWEDTYKFITMNMNIQSSIKL